MRLVPAAAPRDISSVIDAAETRLHAFSAKYAITLLRLSLGFVFVLFGVLKFFPNLSPAQGIAEDTTHKLFLGVLPDRVNLTIVAFVEVAVGLLLLSNRYVRFAVVLLLFEMVGILSPIVLLPGMLFGGPHGLPNLLGQYILKDVVLFSAVLVLLSVQRGGRIVPGDHVQALNGAAKPAAEPVAAQPAAPAPERPARREPARRPAVAAAVAAPVAAAPVLAAPSAPGVAPPRKGTPEAAAARRTRAEVVAAVSTRVAAPAAAPRDAATASPLVSALVAVAPAGPNARRRTGGLVRALGVGRERRATVRS